MLSESEIALVRKVKETKNAGEKVDRADAQTLLDLMRREGLPLTKRAMRAAKREGFDTTGIKLDYMS